MSLESYIGAAPRAELHLHLEGAVPPATLLALARKHRIELPAESEEHPSRWFRFRDVDHLTRIDSIICACLQDSGDCEQVTMDAARKVTLLDDLQREMAEHRHLTAAPPERDR